MTIIKDILSVIGAIASVSGAVISAAYYFHVWRWKRQLTWDDALRVAEQLLQQIEGSDWKPDIVIGLGRSGGIWGGWLAGNLGSLPLGVIDVTYEETPVGGRSVAFPGGWQVLSSLKETYPDDRNVLVVEGASSTGQTPREFRQELISKIPDWDVKLAVLYKNPTVAERIDFVGKADLEPWPTRFPWHARAVYRPYLRDILIPTKS